MSSVTVFKWIEEDVRNGSAVKAHTHGAL